MSERAAALLAQAAAEAARASWLRTAPNPRVGALALCRGHVIGRGHHAAWGGAHAEEAALRDAGAWDEASGRPRPGVVDEMVVSLEPCSAGGAGKKRPACVDLLRAAGVRRLLAGAVDPDPRHAGAGLRLLEAAGLEVERGAGEAAFAAANPAFLRALATPARPWVLLKWAASFDGKTAAAAGRSRWISGPAARAEVHDLRALGDGVLAGAGTLRQDDPELTARPGGIAAARQPWRILLVPDGALAPSARVFAAPGPRAWLVADDAPATPALVHAAAAGDRVLRLPRAAAGRGLELAAALAALRDELGLHRLLVEGGPRLHGALLAAGLADAVVRYEAPLLLGGEHGAVLGAAAPDPGLAPRLDAEERAELGADLRRAFLILPPGGAPAS